MTPDLIKTTFCKTGIVPFNCNIVSAEQMAHVKETSCDVYLPAHVSTKVLKLAALFDKLSILEEVTITSELEGGLGSEARVGGDSDDGGSGSGPQTHGGSVSTNGLAVGHTQGHTTQGSVDESTSVAIGNTLNSINAFI